MKVRKIPTRLCVGCKESYPKRDLMRIVKNKEGNIFFDTTGKQAGRGAYICKNKECFQKAIKNQGFDKAFKEKVAISLLEKVEDEIFSDS